MISTVDIELNAAKPEFPQCFTTFVESPSQVRVRGVPGPIGKWKITKVYASVEYPGNTISSVELTKIGEFWCGTLSAPDTSGKVEAGFQITADGVDEEGNAVTGYALGVGDVYVLERDGTITIGAKTYTFHLFQDNAPTNPKPGDVFVFDGVCKYYDGEAWRPFAESVAVVPPSTNPADAGKAADAKATGDALAARPTKSQLDAGWWSDWTILRDGVDVTAQVNQPEFVNDQGDRFWDVSCIADDYDASEPQQDDEYVDTLSWKAVDNNETFHYYTATRHRVAAPVPTKPSDIGAAPATNIPKTALASNVQTSLELADTAVQPANIDPLLFAQYYPDGSVKSAAEFTSGIKYDFATNGTERTAMAKPFCNTGDSYNDNSALSGRVVIPPFVDASGNGYISDDGTRYKVVGVSVGTEEAEANRNLTAIVAPNTVTSIKGLAFYLCSSLASVSLPAATSIKGLAFYLCSSLASVSLPAATSIGEEAFYSCYALTSVSLPAATTIGDGAFSHCSSLASVSLPAATTIGDGNFNGAFANCTSLASVSLPAATSIEVEAFANCTSLASVDFGSTLSSVPTLGFDAFSGVPTSCKIIVPDAKYDAWIAASGWEDLYNNGNGYKFLRHSEWEYARRYELAGKQDSLSAAQLANIAAVPDKADASALRYDLVTITTGQLQDRAVQKVTLNAASTTLVLPALTDLSGRVADFGIDMVNAYAPEVDGTPTPTAASFSLAGTIGTDYNIIVPEGEDWSEMSALAAGEMAQFYFTLSAFAINDKPTWKIVKQVVELVPVPTAP